ncbi:MAG: glycosyltransferase family 4 protein, partial [Chloroflexi bacterium]|nr:glycosyltransferase family 4 protein [Chloroflexota bacterium]
EVRAALGIPVDATLVGAASRLTPWKGQDRFVHAAAKLAERFPTARFVVAGSPEAGQAHQQEYFESLKRLTADLGIADRVLFPGYLSNLQDLMATMDVFVLPSVQPEPFGMVIVEAMALGVPVVATNGGGPREIVRDWETGLLVPPGDSAALADAVGSLLADSNMRARFGAAARDRVRDTFSLEAFRHNLHRLYREGAA